MTTTKRLWQKGGKIRGLKLEVLLEETIWLFTGDVEILFMRIEMKFRRLKAQLNR
jgi:hypothetical protein